MSAYLDPADTCILLIDHQSGLLQTVKDISVTTLRANLVALAKVAKLASLPVITTASEPKGPNGPLLPEIGMILPTAHYVPRNGEVNAWDAPAFVDAVHATGRKTLLIAGIWTSVCVLMPALSALAEGYKVYAILDASGDVSSESARITLARLTQAGVFPTSTTSALAGIQKTWRRDDAAEFGKIYASIAPAYQEVIDSYTSATAG